MHDEVENTIFQEIITRVHTHICIFRNIIKLQVTVSKMKKRPLQHFTPDSRINERDYNKDNYNKIFKNASFFYVIHHLIT